MNTHTPPPTQVTPEVTRLMLRLPADLAERLRRLARAHDRSLNGELTRALRAYVEREERAGERSGE